MSDGAAWASRRGFLALGGGGVAVAALPARAGVDPPDAVTPEMFGARRDDRDHDSAPAINAAFATGRAVRFGPGIYYLGGSVGPGLRHARAHFDDTRLQVKPGARVENFTECLGWDGATLAGRGPDGNLPGLRHPIRVVFDLAGSRFSRFTGQLELRGDPGFDGLALLAASNHARQTGGQSGGGGSLWDCNLVLGFASYGLFGTPRYDAPGNEFYPDPFAGTGFARLRIHSCPTPLLLGANTFDDAFVGVMHLALRDGDRGYVLGTALNAGSVFMRCNGTAATAVAFDVREATLSAATFYAENSFEAPIVLRYGGWINGVLRHGAGSRSRFARGAMVYCDAVEAGGIVTAHERCRDARHMRALVALRADDAAARRSFVVHQPYRLRDKPAFVLDGATGIDTADTLLCYAAGGPAGFRCLDGRLVGLQRSAGGGPFAPLRDPDRPEAAPIHEAFHGAVELRTRARGELRLDLRRASLDGETAAPAGGYSDYRIAAAHPVALRLAPPSAEETGRQVIVSVRDAPVTLLHDETCRLADATDMELRRDGTDRVQLLAGEYWTGQSHRAAWIEIGSRATPGATTEGRR